MRILSINKSCVGVWLLRFAYEILYAQEEVGGMVRVGGWRSPKLLCKEPPPDGAFSKKKKNTGQALLR